MQRKHFYLSDITSLSESRLSEIIENDENLNHSNINIDSKSALEYLVIKKYILEGHQVAVEGTLEILKEGFGFLRCHPKYFPSHCDIYVKHIIIRKLGLRTGDTLCANICQPKNGDKFFTIADVSNVITVNGSPRHNKNGGSGGSLDQIHQLNFEALTPLYPKERLIFEFPRGKNNASLRTVDLICPCGFGQRMLIVAPPRSGKTELLQSMAYSIKYNQPDCILMVLLVGERPEEVTEMISLVGPECVFSSTFDESPARHIQLSELLVEKAKRHVENKKKVIILLDSITRLTRAYNAHLPSSGRVLTGGLDSNAIQAPKSLFGAARNTLEGGSLTIIATALVETGSKMDEVIFEEFKGTGNSDLYLSRKIAEKCIYPAIDINRTGTRREEYLLNPVELNKITKIRKHLSSLNEVESMSLLLNKINKTASNQEFLTAIEDRPSIQK